MARNGAIEAVNLSDTGRKRPHNEDSCITDAGLGLAVVADGMGGYKAGEVASAIAVMRILLDVREGLARLADNQPTSSYGERSARSAIIERAISRANSDIFRTAQSEAQCQGMGTTVVATLFYADKVVIAHVGDSRLYRLRGDSFQQLTSDHSLIQELIDRGFYTPEEAAENTPKNLVTRALGIEAQVQVDVREEPVEVGDTFLLCSDGLNDMVTDEEIRLTLSKYSGNLVHAAQELVRQANANGGKDNISVVLLRANGELGGQQRWYEKFTNVFR